MNYLNALNISGSGMTTQKTRMDVISQNITNSNTTRTQTGGPYRRKMTVLSSIDEAGFRQTLMQQAKFRTAGQTVNSGGVKVAQIVEDQSDFIPTYDPTHPDANEEGYVMMPNVNRTQEMVDLMAASRAYEANVTVFNATKAIIQKALEIGR